MLKITTQADNGSTKLKLEGQMARPWLDELDRCWQAVATAQHTSVVVDLTGVTFITSEGKTLLAQMWRQGAEFHAAGCLNMSIVDDITKTDRSVSPVRKERR